MGRHEHGKSHHTFVMLQCRTITVKYPLLIVAVASFTEFKSFSRKIILKLSVFEQTTNVSFMCSNFAYLIPAVVVVVVAETGAKGSRTWPYRAPAFLRVGQEDSEWAQRTTKGVLPEHIEVWASLQPVF